MQLSVYLDDKFAKKFDKAIKKVHISKSKAIRQALEVWLDSRERKEWSNGLFDFTSYKDFPSKEELREGLIEQHRDVLED